MNKHDLDNLKFLLNTDAASLQEWYSQVTDDDVDYAMELLSQFEKDFFAILEDMALEEILEDVEYQLEEMDSEFTDAQQVLSKIFKA